MVEFFVAQSGRRDLEINEELVARGEELVSSGELTSGSITTCDNCHAEVGGEFALDAENGGIPELNAYGSQAWLKALIANPGHEQFFGDNNKMPAFVDKISRAGTGTAGALHDRRLSAHARRSVSVARSQQASRTRRTLDPDDDDLPSRRWAQRQQRCDSKFTCIDDSRRIATGRSTTATDFLQ